MCHERVRGIFNILERREYGVRSTQNGESQNIGEGRKKNGESQYGARSTQNGESHVIIAFCVLPSPCSVLRTAFSLQLAALRFSVLRTAYSVLRLQTNQACQ